MDGIFVTAEEVADAVGGVVWGKKDTRIYGIALSEDSNERTMTYFERTASKKSIQATVFAACLIPLGAIEMDNRTYIVINKPVGEILHIVLSFLMRRGLYNFSYKGAQNNFSDVIGKNVSIGEGTYIGYGTKIYHNVCIGKGVEIGDNCVINSNVVIHDRVVIGKNVIIQSGAIIGSDSFEYSKDTQYHKIINIGTVVIEDDVEIGSNTTIDRGTIGNTIIGCGSKIDNLVQIGHEVKIGNNCKVRAQCCIAGWSKLENNVVLYGKVAVTNKVIVGENATVLGMSGVSKNVKPGEVVSGIPAIKNRDYLKEKILLRKLIHKKGDKYDN